MAYMTTAEIAATLGVSPFTVHRHVKEIRKLIPERYPYTAVVGQGNGLRIDFDVYAEHAHHLAMRKEEA